MDNGAGTDLTALVGDILQDLERLVGQQFDLLRAEVRQGLERAKSAAVSFGAGGGLLAAGGVLGVLALVHGLHKATRLPLWSCYGLVGSLLGAAGAGLLANGVRQAAGVNLIPEQTGAALKENLSWLKEQVTAAS